MNGAKLKDVRITEETRRAIRAGIESEAYRNGKMLSVCVRTPADPYKKILEMPSCSTRSSSNLSSSLTRILTTCCLYLIHIGNEGRVKYSPPPAHLFFCRKLREYSARSYWSTAKRCENRQRTSIGRHAERTGNPILFVDRQRG